MTLYNILNKEQRKIVANYVVDLEYEALPDIVLADDGAILPETGFTQADLVATANMLFWEDSIPNLSSKEAINFYENVRSVYRSDTPLLLTQDAVDTFGGITRVNVSLTEAFELQRVQQQEGGKLYTYFGNSVELGDYDGLFEAEKDKIIAMLDEVRDTEGKAKSTDADSAVYKWAVKVANNYYAMSGVEGFNLSMDRDASILQRKLNMNIPMEIMPSST
jgi:hypothetical protein